MMDMQKDNKEINDLKQEQMIKLITKAFYNDLINYGIEIKDIVNISTHLLDYVIQTDGNASKNNEYYSHSFKFNDIKNDWSGSKKLSINDISISSLGDEMYVRIESWLRNPEIKYSFISMFPESAEELKQYFNQSNRSYFGIFYDNEPVGVIGADNINQSSRKIEMRKFIGNAELRGKGIAKHATFLFLYYCFEILNFNKVYIYSSDANINNIHLNSKFGFELEGVFFEDIVIRDKAQDVLRMGLLKSRWLEIFRF